MKPDKASKAQAAIAAEIAALQARSIRTRRVNMDPLPGPLASAFAIAPVTRHGIALRPAVAADFIILRQLDSPLHRHLLNLAEFQQRISSGAAADLPPPKTSVGTEDMFEMVYQFATPSRRIIQELAEGRNVLREHAIKAIGSRCPGDKLKDLIPLAQGNIEAAFSTALEYVAADPDGETTINFANVTGGKADGLGWWLGYVARLASSFPWPLDYILHDLPMSQGFAFIAFNVENNPVVPVQRLTPGYIAQELAKLKPTK